MDLASWFQVRQGQVAVGLHGTRYSKAYTAEVDMRSTNDQSQCILYNKLPSEIRTRIFEFAVASTDDVTKPYLRDRVYYRPGYHYHQKTEVSLLITCKRIFSETRLMPVAETEHLFWLLGGPHQMMKVGISGLARFDEWTASLNEEQRQAVQRVHVFPEQRCLEQRRHSSRLPPLSGLATKHLTLTFRHSGWWGQELPAESSEKLGICPWLQARVSQRRMLAEPLQPDPAYLRQHMGKFTWGHQICQIKGLKTLTIEFEIGMGKKAQLHEVVARAKHWKFPLEGGDVVLEQVGEIRESRWEGLAELKDDNSPVLNPIRTTAEEDSRPRRTYYVCEMVFK